MPNWNSYENVKNRSSLLVFRFSVERPGENQFASGYFERSAVIAGHDGAVQKVHVGQSHQSGALQRIFFRSDLVLFAGQGALQAAQSHDDGTYGRGRWLTVIFRYDGQLHLFGQRSWYRGTINRQNAGCRMH